MESVAELHRRIEELSLVITRQQEVLRDLENTRAAAKRDLNAICDPIARLPLEISSEIFMHCLPDEPGLRPSEAPMILLGICHFWTNIAFSIPTLWATIFTEYKSSEGYRELLEVWIGRAGTLPLSLSWHGPVDLLPGLLVQHAHRLRNLHVDVDASDKSLWSLLASYSSMTKLSLSAELGIYSMDTCVRLLLAAPELVECDLISMFFDRGRPDPLTHPRLQDLRLGKPQVRYARTATTQSTSSYLLRCLTLPALRSLEISFFDILSGDFVSFLNRSSAPLQSLHMHIPENGWTTQTVNEFFRHMSGLRDLHLVGFLGELNNFHPFLETFPTAKDFLPSLRKLTLRGEPRGSDGFLYDRFVSVLSSRRVSGHARLQSFKFIVETELEDPGPDPDVVAALRELTQDGMHIHVGPQGRNYI
ncbi:hypothetical protein DFH07DRAFT_114100 [Mycena maculata]|uniref:F-box domain-containing protein n=1 Tax=Mycena maculata TaxID=230809 RepID=A0AAD7MWG8_9AGAR|nr:hypothetical protein DFH07DRAFT_114100 [Mycena maculata]